MERRDAFQKTDAMTSIVMEAFDSASKQALMRSPSGIHYASRAQFDPHAPRNTQTVPSSHRDFSPSTMSG